MFLVATSAACFSSDVRSSEKGLEVRAPNNHFMKRRRWREARRYAAVTPRLAQDNLQIKANLSPIHASP